MNVDPEIKKLQDSIQRSKVARALDQAIEDKLLDGVRLFDQSRERIKAGIRAKNPELTDEQIHREFLRLLAIQRTREEKDIYTVVGDGGNDEIVTPPQKPV